MPVANKLSFDLNSYHPASNQFHGRSRTQHVCFPLSNINSVPGGTTAFQRTEESNGIVFVSWTPATAPGAPEALDLGEMEKGNTDEVGGMAEELVGILLSGQNPGASKGEELGLGYLNYGALLEN